MTRRSYRVWRGRIVAALGALCGAACAVAAAGAASAAGGDDDRAIAPAPPMASADADAPIDEIIVTGGRLSGARAAAGLVAFDETAIVQTRATDLSEVLARAPGAAVQTNSRGETLAFLRGAGERQTALYFAGAPINVPWDNRLNLDLFPAGALSDVHITSGPASVLFGPNTAGGVIELSPAGFSLSPRATASVQAGEGGLVAGSATGATMVGPAEIVAAAGRLTRDGAPLSGEADLPFFQASDSLRTNTDREQTNALARIAFDQGGPLSASASVLAVDSAFGIAPESRLDPAVDDARFWRYPLHRQIVGVLNARYASLTGFDIATAAWGQRFTQEIDSFASDAYETLEDRQSDRDVSAGLRTVATLPWGDNTVRGAFSVLDARHRQIDETFADGVTTDRDAADFRRRIYSLGAEYERALGDVSVLIGAGGDILESVETGGRPNAGGLAAWSVVAAADWRASRRWSFFAAAGRKPRLPTQRELFGEAIDRFLLNPDLQPETAVQLELGARYASERLALTVTPFGTIVDNTIDQETVTVDGARRRRRINLDGTRAFGADIAGVLTLTEALSLSGQVSVLNLRRRGEADEDARFIAERPALLGLVAAAYEHPSGVRLTLEAERRGRAFSAVDNAFVALPRSTAVNAELAYAPPVGERAGLELYVRVDNLSDALVEPQLGLPEPGRWLRAGARIALQ